MTEDDKPEFEVIKPKWWNSPKKIQDREFKNLGAGYYQSSDGKYYTKDINGTIRRTNFTSMKED